MRNEERPTPSRKSTIGRSYISFLCNSVSASDQVQWWLCLVSFMQQVRIQMGSVADLKRLRRLVIHVWCWAFQSSVTTSCWLLLQIMLEDGLNPWEWSPVTDHSLPKSPKAYTLDSKSLSAWFGRPSAFAYHEWSIWRWKNPLTVAEREVNADFWYYSVRGNFIGVPSLNYLVYSFRFPESGGQ